MQKVQHALAAVMLFADGMRVLQAGQGGLTFWIGVAEVVSGLALVVIVARAIRHTPHAAFGLGAHAEPHHGIDWVDLATAAMLTVEAISHWHERHHLPRPTLLSAALMLLLGLFHGKFQRFMHRRRALHVNDDGLSIGGRRPWNRRLTLGWDEVARIDLSDTTALIVATDGRERRIDLADLYNAPHVVEALEAARTRLPAARPAPP